MLVCYQSIAVSDISSDLLSFGLWYYVSVMYVCLLPVYSCLSYGIFWSLVLCFLLLVEEEEGTYVGAYANGKKNGQGTMTYKVGDARNRKVYEGNWVDGMMEGRG